MKELTEKFNQFKIASISVYKYILYFFSGAFLLSVFSTLQKLSAGYSFKTEGFIVPVFFGGLFGIIAGLEYNKLKCSSAEVENANCLIKDIIDSIPAVIFAVDSKGFITHWNKAAQNEGQEKENSFLNMHICSALNGIVKNPEAVAETVSAGIKKDGF